MTQRSNDKDTKDATTTTSSPRMEERPVTSLRTMAKQFVVVCFAIILHYLRKQGTIILGRKIGLVWGVVPVECLIMAGLIGEMAMRELGFEFW